MIELTDEMERAMYAALNAAEPGRHHAAVRTGLAAVLAIVERDQATRAEVEAATTPPGPCSVALGLITMSGEPYGDLWCQLRHGHAGDHENGRTRWKERAPIDQDGRF